MVMVEPNEAVFTLSDASTSRICKQTIIGRTFHKYRSIVTNYSYYEGGLPCFVS
jgi:hypothetical protein